MPWLKLCGRWISIFSRVLRAFVSNSNQPSKNSGKQCIQCNQTIYANSTKCYSIFVDESRWLRIPTQPICCGTCICAVTGQSTRFSYCLRMCNDFWVTSNVHFPKTLDALHRSSGNWIVWALIIFMEYRPQRAINEFCWRYCSRLHSQSPYSVPTDTVKWLRTLLVPASRSIV